MSNKIIPQPGYVLIKDDSEQKLGSLTIQTDENNREGIIGKVLAVGNEEIKHASCGETYAIYSPVKVGDTIAYTRYHFSDLNYLGEKYKIIKFEDIIATIVC